MCFSMLMCVCVCVCVSERESVCFSMLMCVCVCGSGGSSAAVKLASTRLPSPKALVSSPSQILQIPKAQQTVQSVSPKGMQASSPQSASAAAGAKPTFQIKQESGEHTRQQIKLRAAPLKGFSH